MLNTTYLLLISLGAFFILGIFHFTIYQQQKDRAFLHYALYLLVMSAFNVVRLLDARLTGIFPLSYYAIETLDPILSNLGFLMYVNFLGFVLNFTPKEKFFYRCWRGLQLFVTLSLILYFIIRVTGDAMNAGKAIIITSSFLSMSFAFLVLLRVFRQGRDPFFQLIMAGTIVSILGVLSGLIVNVFLFKDNLAFEGLYFMEIGMFIEAIFLSAALGYRLKLAYEEKELFQQGLLEETQKREALALQAAQLLKNELDIRVMQHRISKDLHDDVGSSLSSLQIYSSLATSLMDKQPEQAKKMLQQMAVNTADAMENMNHIVWAMQPAEQHQHTMEARIKDIGLNLLTIKNIQCEYRIAPLIDLACRGMELRKNLVLIIKEAFNNISKYSEATLVTIDLLKQSEKMTLVIADNGIGFDHDNQKPGNGLVNIRARMKSLSGTARIESSPGKGTVITCTVPCT